MSSWLLSHAEPERREAALVAPYELNVLHLIGSSGFSEVGGSLERALMKNYTSGNRAMA